MYLLLGATFANLLVITLTQVQVHCPVKMVRSNKYQSVNLTRFFMKFVGFWLAETPRERLFLDIVLIYAICAIIFAFLVESVDLYHCLGDFYRVTDNLCTTLLLFMIFVKLGNFIIRRKLVLKVITFAENNFWAVEYDENSADILEKYNKRGIFMTYTFTMLVQIATFQYILAPILEKADSNTTERRLPFNLYVDLPITVSPYYEIIYLIQSLSTFHSGICTFCFDNFICTFNIHVAAQFKILACKVGKIADKYAESMNEKITLSHDDILRQASSELKSCIIQHLQLINYVNEMERVFTLIVLGQMLLSSVSICFSGFQILAPVSMVKKCIFLLHFIGSLGQLLIYTWTSNDIIVQSMAIADTAYTSKWYLFPHNSIGKALKYGLYVISVRARKPCILTAGGFTTLSLETFTAILSTSMSYFTVLRQMGDG